MHVQEVKMMRPALQEYGDLECVRQASTPSELLEAMKQVCQDISTGTVRTNPEIPLVEEYGFAANIYNCLEYKIKQWQYALFAH